jgi:hypothetical protein
VSVSICYFIHAYFTVLQEFDDDELEAELDALGQELELEEQEELDKQLLDVGPAVPTQLPEVRLPAFTS